MRSESTISCGGVFQFGGRRMRTESTISCGGVLQFVGRRMRTESTISHGGVSVPFSVYVQLSFCQHQTYISLPQRKTGSYFQSYVS